MPKKRTKVRRRERKSVPAGRAYIQSTFNNTIVTLTDPQGNVIAWGSSGTAGLRARAKALPMLLNWQLVMPPVEEWSMAYAK